MKLDEIYAASRRLERRRRQTSACFALVVAASLAAAAYGAYGAWPYYDAWSRANRIETRSVGWIDAPALVSVEIRYAGDPPANLSLRNEDTGESRYGAVQEIDEENKVIYFSQDLPPDMPSGRYEIALSPGENRKISYKIDVGPSYKYIAAETSAHTDEDGRMWLGVSAHYGHCSEPAGMRLSVQLSGPGYSKSLLDASIGTDADLILCLDRLCDAAGADISKAASLSVALYAQYEPLGEYDGPVPVTATWKASMALDGWPEAPDGDFGPGMSDTDAFIGPEEAPEPEPEPDGAGEEPGGEDDGTNGG